MKPRILIVFVVAVSLALLLAVSTSAQKSDRPIAPPSSGDLGLQNVNAPAVTLGQPGLSFRYVQTFGVTEEAYPADVQHINHPGAVFVDSSDNLFVVEEWGSRVLKYRTSDGANLLSIGTAGMKNRGSYTFDTPEDVAVDSGTNIWVVDHHRAAQYSASGTLIQEFPPEDPWNSGSDNRHFNQPRGIAFDSAGRLYVSDAGNDRIQVYQIVSGSLVYSTTIGTTGVYSSTDGYFNVPSHIAFDSSGRLYVVDINNYRIQRCSFAGDAWTCSTFFGVPGETGNDLAHIGGFFNGITIRNDNIYIADAANHRVLKCDISAVCSVFAGVTGVSGTDDAHLMWPSDVAVDSAGNVYVSEYTNNRIQEFTSSGTWFGRIGVTQIPYVPDTTRYNTPRGLTVAADGSIYFTEGWGFRLVKLNAAGAQQWTVGQAGEPGSDNAHFGYRWDGLTGNLAVDAAGRVYVPDTGNDRVQIFDASNGAFITTWGSSGSGPSQFSCPWGVAISPVNSDFYVVDRCNNRIQIFDSNRVYKTQLGTGVSGSSNTEFADVSGVAVDKQGNIYVADGDTNQRVQKCTVSGVTYNCALFAGVTGESGDDFGHLSGPYSVAVDDSGRVYVADAYNQRVQVFDSTGAYLTTIDGAWGSNTGQMREPKGVALDSQGNVYVTDSRNSRIQKFALGVPGWKQANINGFGDPHNGASALAVFNNQMYAGGNNIWRTADGHTWTMVITNSFGANNTADSFAVFSNTLYAGTYNETGAGIYRTTDGTSWTNVVTAGFGITDNNDIINMTVYSDHLYAATLNNPAGGQIWRSPDGISWTSVITDNFGSRAATGWWTFEEFNGLLYVGSAGSAGGLLYRTDGLTWTAVTTNGFNVPGNGAIPSLAAFKGYLYAGTRNMNNGAQVWRSSTGDPGSWAQVAIGGFDDVNNKRGYGLIVAGDYLYYVITNVASGDQVWRTADGIHWEHVGFDGWGDSNNQYSDYSDKGAVIFNNRLYICTSNGANGSEVWQKLNLVYLPVVLR